MKPIWIIDGEDVTRLQGDSAGFVRLLNALLSRLAHVGGLPDASLRLNQKDSEGDSGVDAVVAILAEKVQEVTGESVELAFVDQGDTGDDAEADAASYGIHLPVVSLPEAKRGFVLWPRRWVVERSFGRMAVATSSAGLRATQRDPGGPALCRLEHPDAA